MNTKSIFLSLTVLLSASSALPCINESDDKDKYSADYDLYFSWESLREALKKDLKSDGVEREARLRGSTRFYDRNDYAIALMFLGRSSEAVELLLKLEAEDSGHFFIAANLGTAYELSGKNTEALKWINEGIRRNPNDHKGTEWLHAKILEAKIAHEKDPAFFEEHSVLGLQPGSNGKLFSISGKSIASEELVKAIQYQLTERLQFVKPPDPVVASLLFDYATIEGRPQTIEAAKLILRMAADYGYPGLKVETLSKRLNRRLAWENSKTYALYVSIGIAVVVLIVSLYKMRVFVLSRKSFKQA